MIDSFVFLTPILMLPVVALLVFVGCNWWYDLDETKLREPGPGPTGLVAIPGNNKVALSWDPYPVPNTTEFNVKRGVVSGSYPTTFQATGNSATDPDAINGTTYFYVVTALPPAPELETEPSEEVTATPSAASLVPFLKPAMLGTPANAASGFYGMAIVVGGVDLEVQTLGRIVIPGNTGIHTLKIVDSQGVDVPNAFVSVNMAGGTPGVFQYAPLPPSVKLSAGATYFIVSQEILGQDQFYNHDGTVTTTNAATLISAVRGGPPYFQDSSLNKPYGLVNFQY